MPVLVLRPSLLPSRDDKMLALKLCIEPDQADFADQMFFLPSNLEETIPNPEAFRPSA